MIYIANYKDTVNELWYRISVSDVHISGIPELTMLIPDIGKGDNSRIDRNRWTKRYMSKLNEINLDSILTLIDTYAGTQDVVLLTGDISYVDYGDLLALWFESNEIDCRKLYSCNRTENDWISELGFTDRELMLNHICRDC